MCVPFITQDFWCLVYRVSLYLFWVLKKKILKNTYPVAIRPEYRNHMVWALTKWNGNSKFWSDICHVKVTKHSASKSQKIKLKTYILFPFQ
jgi:hypothetical protein